MNMQIYKMFKWVHYQAINRLACSTDSIDTLAKVQSGIAANTQCGLHLGLMWDLLWVKWGPSLSHLAYIG